MDNLDSMENPMTAWEELNGRPSGSSAKYRAAREALDKAEADSVPCSLDRAIELLTPNLILCAPSGMSDNDRFEWYKAALATIGDMPSDLLGEACAAARRVCDHPAKIVPFICSHDPNIEKPWLGTMRWRKTYASQCRSRFKNIDAKRLEAKSFELPEEERRGLATDIGSLAAELEQKAQIIQ